MRRTLFTLLAVVALAATVPAVALAFRGHGHARHHGKSAPNSTTASNAGTVTSFSNGQLTITESNGQAVTGTVSRFTRVRFHIQFTPPSSSAKPSAKRERTASKRHFGHGGGFGGGGFGHHHHFGKPTPPTIQPGETVLDASLVLTSKGALWTALDLVAPAPTPPTTTTSTTSTGPTPTTPTTTGPTPTTPTTTSPTPTTPTTSSKAPAHKRHKHPAAR